MNTKQLKYVLALEREGSFSRAAESLNITQPSFSQYIKKIEKELNLSLFDRSGNEVKLTEAGKVYIETGQKILDLEHQMESQFNDMTSYKCGNIKVGISPHRSVCFMPEVIVEFQKQYPGLHIVLDERVGNELIDAAERGEFDLCVTTLPVDEKIFSYDFIMHEDVLVAVPAKSELCDNLRRMSDIKTDREYPTLDVVDLDGEAFVMLGETQKMQHTLEDISDKYGITFHKAVECRSIEAQIAMVKAGMGIAFVPSSIAKVANDSKISFFSLKQDIGGRDIVVAYRKGQYLSKPAEELKRIMKLL